MAAGFDQITDKAAESGEVLCVTRFTLPGRRAARTERQPSPTSAPWVNVALMRVETLALSGGFEAASL